jgi:ATP-binding cassette, subfamily G (WHITE), member 2, SNQ2
VKGIGMGITTNRTFGGIFLIPFKKLLLLFSHWKSPENSQRTLLHDLTGIIKNGEMLLVLGRPGSGCSTFLKAIALQTEGYKSVEGEVFYGGYSAADARKHYRGDVIYNQGIQLLECI